MPVIDATQEYYIPSDYITEDNNIVKVSNHAQQYKEAFQKIIDDSFFEGYQKPACLVAICLIIIATILRARH